MSDPATIDEQLLRQMQEGSEEALVALYRRYQGGLYRFALHMSGNSALAEEVTQETFLQLIQRPQGYQAQRGPLAAFLFGIARNLTRRGLRQQIACDQLEDEALERELSLPGEEDTLQELTRAEDLEQLRKAVLALPEIYREAVVLCDLQETSYSEAAELLGCSPGTVASRLHRARLMLQQRLRSSPCRS